MEIAQKLEVARRELLDLTLRNPLLNYRLLKSKGVEIVDELPEELYRILVAEGKTMTFLPLENKVVTVDKTPEEEKTEVYESENEESSLKELQDSYSDLKIQTNYGEKELQSRLLQTYLSSRTFIEEQGVNILFIAIGMVKWKEDAGADKYLRAPLILVPVELNRSNARSRFTLNYTGEEIRSNLSLHAKLKSEFNIDMPLIDENDDFTVLGYFEHVTQALESKQEWEVSSNDIALGFFSYSKFLMFNDLDMSKWQSGGISFEHGIMNSLLHKGFSEPESDIGDDEHIDKFLNPTETFHVVEADSSQILAIRDINQGRNLVVQGPPGTGKSQTITNIIAEAIGRGKKILFVAEKMAALEVVKRRLDTAGLGDSCLELHSNKTNKKAVLGELQRVLELGRPVIEEYEEQLEKLTRSRDNLNEYCEAVNEPVGKSQISPINAYGELLRLNRLFEKCNVIPPQLQTEDIALMSKAEFERKLDLLREVKAHLKNMGVPSRHPFWCSEIEEFLPTDKQRLERAMKELFESFQALIKNISLLSDSLEAAVPNNYDDLSQLMQTVKSVNNSPDLQGVELRSEAWKHEAGELYNVFKSGYKFNEIRNRYKDILMEEAWDQEVFSLRQTLLPYVDKWWRGFSGEYRRANKSVIGLLKNNTKLTLEVKLELLDAILECRREQKVIEQYRELGGMLFNSSWKGVYSDWEKLKSITDYMIGVHKHIQESIIDNYQYSEIVCFNNCVLHESIFDILDDNPDKTELEKHLGGIVSCLEDFHRNMESTVESIRLNLEKRFKGRTIINSFEFNELQALINSWVEEVGELQMVVVYNHLVTRMLNENLVSLANLIENWEYSAELLDELFMYERCERLIERAFKERKVLSVFEGSKHDYEIENFCNLDENLMRINRVRLAYEHWQRAPRGSSGEGQLGILLWEFQKKSRHLPIRQLLSKAGNVIQAIKPVMMMSPLSIANFLEPGALQFDLVIFDEASQVRPVDAFGAIMRGKQAVVVGDSHQMPPTSFFDYVTGVSEEEENQVGDLESILALFAAQGAPQRMLRWHYRSRHESLIMVSNREFYKNKLVVFPNSEVNVSKSGLIYRYLPDTAYDRGGTRTNLKEARMVAKEVMKHAKKNPELTLGVAAFSVSQMQAIYDQLENLRRNDPSCEEFFKSHPEEPFFVKNLENVQGDERDVIFISVGYGRTAEGNLSMDFGPLNKDGGERRLNVLITRARQKCEVFTNLAPEDIDLNRSSARGVKCLKTFLMYARDRSLESSEEQEYINIPNFEEEVYLALRDKGYEVRKQIGCAGFHVDLAVIDPDNPSRYLLGIECDGITYSSARSARDRDRLRQKVLKDKGWKIHRVWSTDWFREPQRELEKLMKVIDKAKGGYDIFLNDEQEPIYPARLEEVLIERAEYNESEPENKIPEYEMAELGMLSPDILYYPEDIKKNIIEVVKVESPVHINEVLRRIASASGTRRVGNIIHEKFEAAVILAEKSRSIKRKGDFLWLASMKEPMLRNRKNIAQASRKLEYISEEEIRAAVKTVVSLSYGMLAQNVPSAACKLLGFSRVSEDMGTKITEYALKLEEEKELVRQGENMVVGE